MNVVDHYVNEITLARTGWNTCPALHAPLTLPPLLVILNTKQIYQSLLNISIYPNLGCRKGHKTNHVAL